MSKKETKTMKVIVLTVGEKLKIVDLPIEHDYHDIQKLLNINSSIEVAERKVGKKFFDIWCDDEALLKGSDLNCTALAEKSSTNEFLCGNVLIANHDDEGNTTGLSDSDIELIKKHILNVKTIIPDFVNPDDTSCMLIYRNYCGFADVYLKVGSDILCYSI